MVVRAASLSSQAAIRVFNDSMLFCLSAMALTTIPDTGSVASFVMAPTWRASSVIVAFAVVESLASWVRNTVASKLITPCLSIDKPRALALTPLLLTKARAKDCGTERSHVSPARAPVPEALECVAAVRAVVVAFRASTSP